MKQLIMRPPRVGLSPEIEIFLDKKLAILNFEGRRNGASVVIDPQDQGARFQRWNQGEQICYVSTLFDLYPRRSVRSFTKVFRRVTRDGE